MDTMLREPLVKLQIEERIRESEQRTLSRQACSGPRLRQPISSWPASFSWRLRRNFAALLIRAARRLTAGDRPAAQLARHCA